MTPDANLLLVRHAEPLDTDRCHGARSDPGLSPIGARQAAGIALRVRVLTGEFGRVTRLLQSPAARAIGTMVPVADALGRSPATDERWRERDFGEWEGAAWSELWRTAPAEVVADPVAYSAWTPPGGEPADEVADRVAPALADALSGSGTTLVVTHAGAVRQALAIALDVPLATTLRMEVPYGRITVLSRTQDAISLARLGA